MTPIQQKRPEGEALELYEDALRLDREAGEAVHDRDLQEAERLRGLARQAWERYREAAR